MEWNRTASESFQVTRTHAPRPDPFDAETYNLLAKSCEKWLITQLELNKGLGWPAIIVGDAVGWWTTASALRVLSTHSDVEDATLIKVYESLVNGECKNYGWSVINGENGSSVCTAEVVSAGVALKRRLPASRISEEIQKTIQRAVNWLKHTQNLDGGWGLEPMKGQEGASRAYCTAYALLALTDASVPSSDEAVSHAKSFLTSCRKPNGLWSDMPAGEGKLALSSFVGFALQKTFPAEFPVAHLFSCLDRCLRLRTGVLPSLPVEPEEILRRDGAVNFHTPGHHWACRLALETITPHAGALAMANYLTKSDGLPFRLTCLETDQLYDPTVWVTAELYEIIRLFERALRSDPTFMVKSVASAIGVLSGEGALMFSKAISDQRLHLGDAVFNSLFAEESRLNPFQHASCASYALQLIDENAAKRFNEKLRAQIHLAIMATSDGRLIPEQVFQSSRVPHGDVEVVQEILNSLSSLAREDYGNALKIVHQLAFNRPLLPVLDVQVIDAIRKLASCLNISPAETGPTAQLSLGAATRHLAELNQLLAPVLASPFIRDCMDRTQGSVERKRNTLRSASDLFVAIEGTLSQQEESLIKVTIRNFLDPLTSVSVTVVDGSQVTCIPTSVLAEPTPLTDFVACVALTSSVPNKCSIVLKINCCNAVGERKEIVTSYSVDVRDTVTESSEIWKPIDYIFTFGPVAKDQNFVGREELLTVLEKTLTKKNQACAITGEWRIGKSSLLGRLEERLLQHQSTYVATIDIQNHPDCSLAMFVKLLVEEGAKALETSGVNRGKGHQLWDGLIDTIRKLEELKVGIAGVKLQNLEEASLAVVERMLGRFLELEKKLNEKNIVLVYLIDEFNLLHKSNDAKSIITFFRGLVVKSSAIRFLVAGYDIFAPFAQFDPPISNVFRIEPIEGLSLAETRQLIGLAGAHLNIDLPLIEKLHQNCGGHPYWLSAVCNQLVQELNRAKTHTVTAAILDRAIGVAVSNQSTVLERLWSDITEDGANACATTVVETLANAGGRMLVSGLATRIEAHVERSKMLTTLSRLKTKGVLVRTGNYVALKNPLFARWVFEQSQIV